MTSILRAAACAAVSMAALVAGGGAAQAQVPVGAGGQLQQIPPLPLTDTPDPELGLTRKTPVAIPAAPRGADREPDLVGRRQPVHALEHQFEAEAELHLQDDQHGRLAVAHAHHVAAADLALGLEASGGQELLDSRVERDFPQGRGLPRSR